LLEIPADAGISDCGTGVSTGGRRGKNAFGGGRSRKKYGYIFITVYKGVYSEVGVYLFFVYVKESFP
jgi:hypothetical protein